MLVITGFGGAAVGSGFLHFLSNSILLAGARSRGQNTMSSSKAEHSLAFQTHENTSSLRHSSSSSCWGEGERPPTRRSRAESTYPHIPRLDWLRIAVEKETPKGRGVTD